MTDTIEKNVARLIIYIIKMFLLGIINIVYMEISIYKSL